MITNAYPNTLLTEAQRDDLTQELSAELGRINRRIESLEYSDSDDGDEERASLTEKQASFEAALNRIETKQYGICVDCSAPIPYGRLLLQPETERCNECHIAATRRGVQAAA